MRSQLLQLLLQLIEQIFLLLKSLKLLILLSFVLPQVLQELLLHVLYVLLLLLVFISQVFYLLQITLILVGLILLFFLKILDQKLMVFSIGEGSFERTSVLAKIKGLLVYLGRLRGVERVLDVVLGEGGGF